MQAESFRRERNGANPCWTMRMRVHLENQQKQHLEYAKHMKNEYRYLVINLS